MGPTATHTSLLQRIKSLNFENYLFLINHNNHPTFCPFIMVLILLTFLAGKVIYDERRERKMRKAELSEATAKALRSKQQVTPPPNITVTQMQVLCMSLPSKILVLQHIKRKTRPHRLFP